MKCIKYSSICRCKFAFFFGKAVLDRKEMIMQGMLDCKMYMGIVKCSEFVLVRKCFCFFDSESWILGNGILKAEPFCVYDFEKIRT